MRRSCCSQRIARLVALLLTGSLACATLTIPEERELGQQAERELRREFFFVRDATINRYVSEIGEQVLVAAGPQPFEYRFFVVEDDEINAFAAPGGAIYVHTGTILAARNVSELAGVIAHEIGHVVHRHVAENYNRQRSTNLLYQLGVVGASFFGFGGLAQVGGGLAAMAVLNSFGRGAEMEADGFAVEHLPAAGYDPSGMVTFFETLQREGGTRVPAFLSSHPATEDRIAAARAGIAALPPPRGALRVDDRGRLEIIQRRIQLLSGHAGGRR
jgi:predicted Zn-dependent protease